MGKLFRIYADRTYLKFPRSEEEQDRPAYEVPPDLVAELGKRLPAPDDDDPE